MLSCRFELMKIAKLCKPHLRILSFPSHTIELSKCNLPKTWKVNRVDLPGVSTSTLELAWKMVSYCVVKVCNLFCQLICVRQS